ncbi:MAG TPA: hypothetical protein VGK25_07640 [Ignavibacteria bacterium]|jgi:hypothetical protein
MERYILFISIWFVISVIALLLFRFIPKKMKEVTDPQTKNSLYTILIFLGIPMLLVSILAPPVFLIGDKNMDLIYKLIWGALCLVFIVYFLIKQKNK